MLVVVCACCVGEAAGVQQAFLVQNSGWMEAFYLDPRSELKPLVAATAETVTPPGEAVVLLSFNQTTPGNVSPMLRYQGPTGAAFRQALGAIEVAKKNGNALADTDFNEAVFKTITGPFNRKTGILWIFTNNKNSPKNDPATAARNLDFYNLIHNEPAIARSLALPLAMPVAGRFPANGLMVYALAYGPEADAELQAIVSSGRLRRLFTQAPAQLKPLDRDAIRFVPKTMIDASDKSTSLGTDGRTIDLEVDGSRKRPVVRIDAAIENMFFPYAIERANISADIVGDHWQSPLRIEPSSIIALAPGHASNVTIAIPIATDFPSPWSLAALASAGRDVRVQATLRVRLDRQQLVLDEAFLARLGEIFPNDPLPSAFKPPSTVESSVADIPVLIKVSYPLWPLLVAIAAGLALILSLVFAITRTRAPASYALSVDGSRRRINLAPFASAPVLDPEGRIIAVVRRRLAAPVVGQVVPPHRVSLEPGD